MFHGRFPTIWADFGRARADGLSDLPVETVRVGATFLLVSYHVVGSTPGNGLQIDYPHMARILADLLRDLRMPLFAFIAGLVYAVKPIRPDDLARFFSGKMRRLVVPGAVAVALSVIVANAVGASSAHDGPLWQLAVYPYVHYWFLMSIMVIFAVFAPIDALTGGRALLPALGASIALSLSGWSIYPDLFSVGGAIYLAPYFLLGASFLRYRERISAHLGMVTLTAAIAVALTLAVQLAGLGATGKVPNGHRDLQSLAMGFGICLLAIAILPRLRALDRFGPYSFTIYLYHIFGLAGCRHALDAFGVEGRAINLALGIACGLGLPIALHLVAARWGFLRVAMLGLRPSRKIATVAVR